MPEETSAASSSTSMEEKPCSSTSAAVDGSVDVMEEAKKLIGTGNRHLVMGDIVSAVNVFQEACGMLAQRYGDTADECAEALFLCGKSLLELARMENSVLGNALEGVPEEEGDEEEKPDGSKVESADNLDEKTRDELRVQVYEAMAERDPTEGAGSETEPKDGKTDAELKDGKTDTELKDGKTDAELKDGKTDAEPKDGKTDAEPKDGKTDAEPKDGKTDAEQKDGKTDAELKDGKTDAELKDGKTDAELKDGKTDAELKDGKTDAELKDGKTDAELKDGKTDAELKDGKTDSELKDGKTDAELKDGKTDAELKDGKTDAELKDGKTDAELKDGKTDAELKDGKTDAELKDGKTDSELKDGKTDEAEKESKPETGEEDIGEEDSAEGNDDDDDDDEDGDGNTEDKEEEEVGNLQLAWEMLEVAKVIYKRKDNKEDQLMAAQAYLKLGEVSSESGNYPQALEDFQECLALQLKHLPPHSRLLAESNYNVATTLCYMDQYSQAIQHYNSSIKVIENRLAMLQEMIEAAGDAATEMEELKLLLPEVREKVEDAKESQRTATASQAIQQTLLGGASTSSAFTGENGGSGSAFPTASQISVRPSDGASSSKSISDISHLVRKKRKPEEGEELPGDDGDAKQAKQEATVNGSAAGKGVQEERKEPAKPSASVGS